MSIQVRGQGWRTRNSLPKAKVPANLKTRHRILIADDDSIFARRLSDYLWDHGFEARVACTVSEAKELVEFWRPDTVMVDLMLPATNALSLMKFIQTKALKKTPRVVVMSRQSLQRGIDQVRKAGAAEYLVKPFSMEDVIASLKLHEQPKSEPAPVAAIAGAVAVDTENSNPSISGLGPNPLKELHLINLFLKQAMLANDRAGLHKLMRMINMKVGAIRTSVIECVNDDTAIVLASNDDENIWGLPINLKNYPEIEEVRRTKQPVIIPNIHTSEVLANVHLRITRTPYVAIVVFPVFRQGQFVGALSVRMEQKDPAEIFYTEKFGTVCAQIISLTMRN